MPEIELSDLTPYLHANGIRVSKTDRLILRHHGLMIIADTLDEVKSKLVAYLKELKYTHIFNASIEPDYRTQRIVFVFNYYVESQ